MWDRDLLRGRENGAVLVRTAILKRKFNELYLCWGVHSPSRWGQPIGEEEKAFLCHRTWSSYKRSAGIGVAAEAACGAKRWNSWKLKQERASATGFSFPAIWVAVNEKQCWAAKRDRWRRRAIKSGSREVPDRNTSTTAILSEQNSTRLDDHRGLQSAAASTTGNNSF